MDDSTGHERLSRVGNATIAATKLSNKRNMLKSDRMWLREDGISCISYAPGSSHGWSASFYITDGLNTLVFNAQTARNLAEFIIRKLDEETRHASL